MHQRVEKGHHKIVCISLRLLHASMRRLCRIWIGEQRAETTRPRRPAFLHLGDCNSYQGRLQKAACKHHDSTGA